jgi:hypothetical protein
VEEGMPPKATKPFISLLQKVWQDQSIGKVKTEIKTDILVEFISR